MNQEVLSADAGQDVVAKAKKAYSRSLLNLAIYAVIGVVLVNVIAIIVYAAWGTSGEAASVADTTTTAFETTVQTTLTFETTAYVSETTAATEIASEAAAGSDTPEIPTTVMYLIQFLPMYLVAFPIYLLLSKNMETAPPEQHSMKLSHIILAFFCCEGISVAGNYIGTFFNLFLTNLLGVETSATFLEEGVFGDSAILFGCIATLCAPFVEEMLFRKVLIDRIRKYGDGTAILISGLMFGLFHGNFTQFFYAAGMGAMFAFIYIRTGRVRYTIALHFMANFLGSVVPMITLRNVDYNGLMEALENNQISTLIGMAGQLIPFFIHLACIWMMVITGVILLIVFRKRFTVNPPITPLPKGKKLEAVCMNVGFWVFVVFCVVEFVMQILQNLPALTE